MCPVIGVSSPARLFTDRYVGELIASAVCCNGIFCLCIFIHLLYILADTVLPGISVFATSSAIPDFLFFLVTFLSTVVVVSVVDIL